MGEGGDSVGGDTGEGQGTGAGPGDATGGYGGGSIGDSAIQNADGSLGLEGVAITGSPSAIGLSGDPLGFNLSMLDNVGLEQNTPYDHPQIPVEYDWLDKVKGFLAQHQEGLTAFGKAALGLAAKGNPAAQLGMAAYGLMSNPVGQVGGRVGASLGDALGFGPVGTGLSAMAGGYGMSALASNNPGIATDTASSKAGGDMNYYDLGAGLGNLYLQGRNARQTSGLADSLASLYTQDSPYAQMLRQQLNRQDAASGRRSQYGNREVELQARLAALNSQNAPQLHQLQQSANLQRMQQLNQLWALNRQGGGKLVGDLYDSAKSGLGSLYNGAQNMYNNYMQPAPEYTPSMDWYAGGGA